MTTTRTRKPENSLMLESDYLVFIAVGVGCLLLAAAPALGAKPAFEPTPDSFELPSNAGVDSTVATFKATDADGDTVTYSLESSGNTQGVFTIDATTGAVTLAKKLDYPSVQKYSLTVKATAGGEAVTAPLVVNVRAASIAELIGATKPMTAVLFSGQDRNSFEVVKDPNDPTKGIINQNQSGRTAGILFAAENPFAFPTKNTKLGESTIPIGIWYGVQLKTGGGDEVGDVDLAAGFSVSFLSTKQTTAVLQGGGAGVSSSGRLLLGVVYGDVVTLGAEGPGQAFQVGDPFTLGEDPPLRRHKRISLAVGLGFRF